MGLQQNSALITEAFNTIMYNNKTISGRRSLQQHRQKAPEKEFRRARKKLK
jgi:hypothetical protein